MTALMGIDLGAKHTAFVIVPADWEGDWRLVLHSYAGCELASDATRTERAVRTERIAEEAIRFGKDMDVTECWFEQYAYSESMVAYTIGEIGGVVQLELVRAGFEPLTAPLSTSRKLLMGKVPRKAPKEAVHLHLRSLGAPWAKLKTKGRDESDAFVAVNWGMFKGGHHYLGQSSYLRR